MGVGLLRELPRHLGPGVCEIPVRGFGQTIALIGSANRIAVSPVQDAFRAKRFDIYDTETGKCVWAWEGPSTHDLAAELYLTVRHGVALVRPRAAPEALSTLQGIEVIGILDNLRVPLNSDAARPTIHPDRRWLPAVEDADLSSGGGQRVRVLDFGTGAELSAVRIGPGDTLEGAPSFIQGDYVAIPVSRAGASAVLEIWRMSTPPVLERRVAHTLDRELPSLSRDGRLMIASESTVEVVDPDTGRALFTTPLPEVVANQRSLPRRATSKISADGRVLFVGKLGTDKSAFWGVDSGRLIWRCGSHESAVPAMAHHLVVFEDWKRLWTGVATPIDTSGAKESLFETTAFRSYETGRVALRLAGRRLRVPQILNTSGTLAADHFGNIYQWPPRPNYPLLALCQFILALPLILVWAVLRWRRNRRFRLASAKP